MAKKRSRKIPWWVSVILLCVCPQMLVDASLHAEARIEIRVASVETQAPQERSKSAAEWLDSGSC